MNSFNTCSPEDQIRYPAWEVFEAGMFNHHIANTAYPIKHGETMWFYRPRTETGSLSKEGKRSLINTAWKDYDDIWLYVHVPFCEHRCGFCDYAVVDPSEFNNAIGHENYFKALSKEMELFHAIYGSKSLTWFDIGWGTPSLVDSKYIGGIMDDAHKYFSLPNNLNISIETTPRVAAEHPDKIRSYLDMGINRISMWVQTINPKLLQDLWRTNTSLAWNLQATESIRNAWFRSFNIDIMYGLPKMKLEQVEATLKHILSLKPDHVTMYRTRYKGTKLQWPWYNIELEWILEQWKLIKDTLRDQGYHALTGKNTFSNIPWDTGASDYLTNRVVHGTPYVWFWLWSQSLSPTILSYNQGVANKDRKQYQNDIYEGRLPIQDIYHLSAEMSAWKFVAVSFYFGGIHLPSFTKNYNCTLESMFPEEVAFVIKEGLMQYEDDRLQLTEHGVSHFNGTISLFYAWWIKKYLIERMHTEKSLQIN